MRYGDRRSRSLSFCPWATPVRVLASEIGFWLPPISTIPPRGSEASNCAGVGPLPAKSSKVWVLGPPPPGVQLLVEHRVDGGVEVQHQVAPEQSRGFGGRRVQPCRVGLLRRSADAAAQREADRLDRRRRDDHQVGALGVRRAIGVDVGHPGGPPPSVAAIGVPFDAGHGRLAAQLDTAAGQRVLEHPHAATLGVDRASVAEAEGAVVAGRPSPVGPGVDRGGHRGGMQPAARRGIGEQEVAVHRHPGRHREGRAPGRLLGVGIDHPAGRVPEGGALDADHLLHHRVERLEVAMGHRPVGVGGPGDRRPITAAAEQRVGHQVDLAQPPRLGVVVRGRPADHGRQVVDVTDEGARPRLHRGPEAARLEHRVLVDGGDARLPAELVVGEGRGHLGGVAAQPAVHAPPLLQDQHVPVAAATEDARHRRAGGAAADDHRSAPAAPVVDDDGSNCDAGGGGRGGRGGDGDGLHEPSPKSVIKACSTAGSAAPTSAALTGRNSR